MAVAFLTGLLALGWVCPLRASRIELKENGYTGIVVALSARLQGNVAGRQLISPLEVSVTLSFPFVSPMYSGLLVIDNVISS